LLDFYSDKSTGHASFFVATIFGMFTILSITKEGFSINQQFFLAITYWLLVGAAL
jgi:hypothetical protein